MELERHDTHLDVALDDEPASSRSPVFVDVVSKETGRAPIVPAAWRGRSNISASLRYWSGLWAHRSAYHLLRAPHIYYPKMLGYGFVGLFKATWALLCWWWLVESTSTRQKAASEGDYFTWEKNLKVTRKVRLFRGVFVLLPVLLALTTGVVITAFQPRWVQIIVVLLVLPLFAPFGHTPDKRIVRPAVVTPRFRRINPDIVLRAYYAAGLGHPDKPDMQIHFGSTMSRDRNQTGSQVVIDLPFGKAFSEVVTAKEKLASGLDVSEYQVFVTRDPTSARRHMLFVADRDPLAISAGKTDLLDLKPRNIWRPMKLGRDERDQLVTLSLLWISLLIGAQPRKGKTFTARLVTLYAALDPYVRIFLADGKKSPDWDKFALVAEDMVMGDNPNPRDTDPLGHFDDMLDEILRHIDRVNDELSRLPVDLCPEGKLTEQLSRDPRFPNLRVLLLAVEEFQVYFETVDQEFNKRIAGKLARIQAVGPSAGVIVVSSSQKPSGVGAGDVGRLFNRYRDNHAVRFALKCGNRDVSMAVLGGDAYGEGYDASALPSGPEYRGVGYLYGASDHTPTVRTFLADHADAERILTAARRHREAAGTLAGLAAGEAATRQARDVLADVLKVFAHTGRPQLQWERLAELLAESMPETYAGVTAEAISAEVRAEGVPAPNVREGDVVRKGCKVAHVQAAVNRRAIKM